MEILKATPNEATVSLEEMAAAAALGSLAVGEGPDKLYLAATPGYPQNFSRDSLTAKLLSGDEVGLGAQVAYSASCQGRRPNSFTGEEKGKIHHQLPSVEFGSVNTAYNACDTTALFLISVAALAELGDAQILERYEPNINEAIAYIKRHVRGGLFYEDPALADAEKFGLRVTYWKDSILNHETKEEPVYPIIYSLAHFQNAAALGKIGKALNQPNLQALADSMTTNGLRYLWRQDHFVTAIDAEGLIDSPSTDSLHALLYIAPHDLPVGYGPRIERYMKPLITSAGYRSGLPAAPGRDEYHTRYVWTHEQAPLAAAAERHNLNEAAEVTKRIINYFNPAEGVFSELVDPGPMQPAGNLLQLWAVGAYLYFKQPDRALI